MIHRFLVDKVTSGGYAFVEGREVRHARKVLRLSSGDRIILFDNEGNEYEAELLRYHSKEKMEAKILGELARDVEISTEITLILGLCRSKQFELALQKCTELGVHRFIPLETDYSILKMKDAEKKIARWQDIVLDATKQSARTQIPEVFPPRTIKSLAEDFEINENNSIFASLSSEVLSIDTVIEKIKGSKERFVIVGPEGGFSPKEVDFARNHNWNFASLGKTVLRTETAAIFLSSVLRYELDK